MEDFDRLGVFYLGKALSNAGTWFMGRLQTEPDKARVMEGLAGAAGGFDKQAIERTLAAGQAARATESGHPDKPALPPDVSILFFGSAWEPRIRKV